MPAISRDRIDLAKTGHPCTFQIGCIATQGSVVANGIAVLRPGDRCLPHTILRRCGKYPCCLPHRAKVNMGSSSVFALGIPVARAGDSTDQGALFQGSPNVFAGG